MFTLSVIIKCVPALERKGHILKITNTKTFFLIHRIIESLRLEKTTTIIQSNC